ncbi:MAG: 9-O-acetylesterase, partial [Phycisphaerae bacterium]|nr:9-O-acetylesterase [Phycisphaerae bacterium]
MFRHRHFAATLGIAFGLFTGTLATADVRLPHLFSDHMVLQRDMPVPVWGWASPGEKITVTLNQHTVRTDSDADGAWRVTLPALQAGGPHTLVVRGNNTITINDVLVGEVWLCSGQSNMEMGVGAAMNAKEEIAAAKFPRIRLFELPLTSAGEPAPDVNANWRVCSPDTIAAGNWGGFSAIGYYFGRELHRELDVPIGLIDSCWGGTRIGSWTPPCGFAAVPAVAHYADEVRQKDTEYKQQELPRKLEELEAWIGATRTALAA